MSPAKRSQKFPFFCTFNRHSDETAKKIILCKNLRTFLMSSATQTYNTHTLRPVSSFGPIPAENPCIIPSGSLPQT